MNSKLRHLIIAATVASLPLSLGAQSAGSSTPSSTSNQTGSANQTGASDQTGSASATGSRSSSTGSSSRTGSTSSSPSSSTSGTMRSASTSSGMGGGVGSIRRLNDDAVERQFTAKDLIGKEVYDSSGKRIGEVKDIVIASSTNPQLSSALGQGESMASGDTSTTRSSTGTTRTASGSIGGVGASGSVTTGGERGVSASGTLGGTSAANAAGDLSHRAQSMMGAMSENAVIVSYGGFLGAGSSLLRVPLSQLNYDNDNRRITVNVAETELSSLPEATETSRSAAE